MSLFETDREIFDAIHDETDRQESQIILIASENYVSEAVLEASGSVMTNKYAEGYPGKRYYEGCENVDRAETLAIDRAKKLFNADFANVQPHSGAQANMAVMLSVLDHGDTVLSMELSHGGHLSHGSPVNFSGKYFNIVSYGVDEKTECIDYDEVSRLAREHRPKMIITGASSYPRHIDFDRFGEIGADVDAVVMADIAHIGGLVVAKLHCDPIPSCQVTTCTTHKTLRGPRGGLILSGEEFAKTINSRVFPGTQGGPLMNTIAAKAVAFKEAMTDDFKEYQRQIVANAATMADVLLSRGFRLVGGGTDNHLFLVDVGIAGLTGADAAQALYRAGICANKNGIPFDARPPRVTSGVRFGTPAITTRGLKEGDAAVVANLIADILDDIGNEDKIVKTRQYVREFLEDFPLYRHRIDTERVSFEEGDYSKRQGV
ncbi:MAG: serine hydroxymethyltransferase [Deltaproteobacteria bacterium]|nr:serine hydroxymethyltransferase [Candidatus Zymogenaceae bacterium]